MLFIGKPIGRSLMYRPKNMLLNIVCHPIPSLQTINYFYCTDLRQLCLPHFVRRSHLGPREGIFHATAGGGKCTTSVLACGERMRDGKIRGGNVFRRRKNRILPLRFGSTSASTLPLQFDIRNMLQIRTQNKCSSARRLLSRRSKRVPQIASAPEIGWGNRIFEISRRLISQNSQIPNPTLKKGRK